MGRHRSVGVMLPPDVQVVTKPSGKVYYYYAPGRGTKNAGVRIPLGSDSNDPEFWRRLRDARTPDQNRDGTLSALFGAYKASKQFTDLRPESRRGYTHFLNGLEVRAGDRLVSAMTRRDIYSLMDSMSDKPVSANYMLAVLRAVLEWGVPRGYRDDNPAIGVKRLRTEDGGHAPWPEADMPVSWQTHRRTCAVWRSWAPLQASGFPIWSGCAPLILSRTASICVSASSAIKRISCR